MLFSLFFTSYWFFGNLYEEIVLVPNLLVNTTHALWHWQAYFRISLPTYYYVPLTQISTFTIWCLYFNADNAETKSFLKKASLFGFLAILLTAAIVTQINLKLFFGDLTLYTEDELYRLVLLWLIGNLVRIYLVGSVFYFLLKAHTRTRDAKLN